MTPDEYPMSPIELLRSCLEDLGFDINSTLPEETCAEHGHIVRPSLSFLEVAEVRRFFQLLSRRGFPIMERLDSRDWEATITPFDMDDGRIYLGFDVSIPPDDIEDAIEDAIVALNTRVLA